MQFIIKKLSILHALGCLLFLLLVNTIIKLSHVERDLILLQNYQNNIHKNAHYIGSSNKNNIKQHRDGEALIKHHNSNNKQHRNKVNIKKETITQHSKKLQQQQWEQKREERTQQRLKKTQKVEKLQLQQQSQRPPQQQNNKNVATSSSSIKRQKIAFIHTNNDVSTYDILHAKLPKILKQYQQQQQHTNNNTTIELEEVYYGSNPKNQLLSTYTTIIIPIWNPYTRMLYNLQHYNSNDNDNNNNTDILYNSINNFFNNDIDNMITLGLRKYKFTSNHRMERCQLNTRLWFYNTYYKNNFYPTLSFMQELLMNFNNNEDNDNSKKKNKEELKLLKHFYGHNNIIALRIDNINDFYIDLNNTILGSIAMNEDMITTNDSSSSSSSNNLNNTTNEIKLSKEGQNNICAILCTEIQIYKKIVLSQTKKSSSKEKMLFKLKNDCPIEYHTNICKEKKRKNTGYYKPIYDSTKGWNDYDNVTIPKHVDIGNQTLIDISNEKRKIAFVHIGKTGGVTASTMIRKKCFFGTCTKNPNITTPENIPSNETQISLQVKEYFHGRRPNTNPYNSFIIIARHPIQRFISFYLHKHPNNGLVKNKDKHGFYKCFPTIDILANFEIIYKNNEDCKMKAFGFFRTSQMHKMYTQDITNTTAIRNNKNRKKEVNEVFLLRTEFFWDDWQSINTMLGGGKITKVKSITHYECSAHKPTITNRTISSNGMKTLCYYMCRDIQAYTLLLKRAVNLNGNEKSISWKMLSDTCPYIITLDECPSITS